MKLTFHLHYNTTWGELIRLVLTQNGTTQYLPMQFQFGGHWALNVEIKKNAPTIEYRYQLVHATSGAILREEWGPDHSFSPKSYGQEHVWIKNVWRNVLHPETALYSSAFRRAIFKTPCYSKPKTSNPSKAAVSVTFQISAPRVNETEQLCVVGGIPELGNWGTAQPLLLYSEQFALWENTIALSAPGTFEYKYALYNTVTGTITALESGNSRLVQKESWEEPTGALVVQDAYFQHPAGNWKGAGVALPVFGLRSDIGLGTGEFNDLFEWIDWAHQCGLQMVQILPVNDTTANHTWVDSYPYAAISVFGLHPLYLHLDALDAPLDSNWTKKLKSQRTTLNLLPEIDYEAVMQFKLAYARAAYEAVADTFLQDKATLAFIQENAFWIKSYAAFCYLRDLYQTPDFSKWPEHYKYNESAIDQLLTKGSKSAREIGFWIYVQFHLDKQLAAATKYARTKGIVLKGDIAIGIYRHSADAWVAPHLYNMDGQAGAPPDDFAVNGQNWGFPTYNWDAMASDGYLWWKQRFQQLSRYFDAFRIDHILGFFRIWQIPSDQIQGIMGVFNPALPVYKEEFANAGVAFDYQRFCQPFIHEHLLQQWFGELALEVKKHFLDPTADKSLYQLRKDCNSQVLIAEKLKNPELNKLADHQEKLLDLVSNVLFFEVPGSNGTQFHPRINFKDTIAFQWLPDHLKHGLLALHDDYFYTRQNDFWREKALEKLPALKKASDMLICGEDLGMVPDCVPGVLKDLGMLTLEIQRMSKNPSTEFLQEKDIPYLSVMSPGTHDMSPLREWWEESDRSQIQRFYNHELGFQGGHPYFCETWVATRIIEKHLYWPGMWAVFPIQDLLAMNEQLRRKHPQEERINVPANPKHYWRYRLHLSTKELLTADTFNNHIKNMVKNSGRTTIG